MKNNMSEVKTISIDVINRTIPILNDERIPVINKPNPCYGYTATAKEVWYLIQLPNYYVYEAGTKNIINGHNYYKYFPNESGGGGGEITIDPEVNNTSTNAIQNKAVYKFVNDEVDPLRTKTGMDVAGKTFVIDDVSIEAQAGAEIFNNYEDNKATGSMSHAEGDGTIASGDCSHAEGMSTTAGYCAHSEGMGTGATGAHSHAEGNGTKASANGAHSEGRGTIAASKYQHAQGEYNRKDAENKYAFIIGNGTSDTSRSNAFAVDWKGRIYVNNSDTGVDVLTLNQNIQIADRIYTGTDLTAKFADEISKYSDSWAWIKSRITDGNYDGIHVGDYIPITCSNGYLLTAQIAGINTYTGYGSPAVGNHIDFICKELWEDAHTFNQVNYNNGNANNSNPFLASDLNCWLNSTTGSVPNSESDASITTAVDYTTGGVLSFLPDSLKSQIVPKTTALPGRYTEGSILKDDNSQEWQSTGKLWIPSEAEVYGTSCWGNSGYGTCGFVQYPIFANNMNRAKIKCTSKEQGNYWLLSACADQSTYVTNVNASGICDSSYATATNVTVPICFRI